MTTLVAVTGTDTSVGKTAVACAIAADAVSRGVRVHVFKPIETGVVDPHAGRDAHLLAQAAGGRQPIMEVSPVTFRDPLAPLAAARLAGVAIDIQALDAAFVAAGRDAELMVIEGAGGLLVPITPTESYASLFRRWGGSSGIPLIIVAPNRLGVLNHVLLTVRVAAADGLPVAAVVLHDRDPDERDASSESNAAILRELLPLVPLVRFPWVVSVADHSELAQAARQCGLGPIIDALVHRDSRSPL